MAVTPLKLSGSTNGRGIVITSFTAASGTLLHTTATATGVSKFDEIYVSVQNLATISRQVTINAGGLVSGDRIQQSIPARDGLHTMIHGLRFNGGVALRAYTVSAGINQVVVHGVVNRNS